MQDIVTTFLFTDIEGSTRLWEQEPERMPTALARHDALARAAVESNGGQVVKMTGDGLHAAFALADRALRAAIELQLALADPGATNGIALRVRCGLHAGAHERRDNDFYGTSVNRAARIMGAAHGGQVLVSEAVVQHMGDRPLPDVSFRDLGSVRLRDLARPERLFQVTHPGLRAEFPPLHSLEETPNNLPQALSSFVGREREIAQVKGLLLDNRLVTVLGMGGLGKTRLSLHVAAESLEEHRDGVWLVELAPVNDAGLIAQAVGSVLGVKEDAGCSLGEALTRYVRKRSLLIVLDNCEHLLAGAAAMAHQLLSAGGGVRVLATSREPLRIAGEATYAIGGLPVPGPRVPVLPDALAQYEAVRLFVDRAAAAAPGFRLTPENAPAVAAICHRLDGIPLAIELAAARCRSIAVHEIALRLKDRFRLLASGNPTALPRQRTLRALIDWSHEMLPDAERVLFRQFAVFQGGCSLEAAEEVCQAGDEPVLDTLSHLVEKSLVIPNDDASRYRMLETVRQYALDRLEEAGEGPSLRDRHLRHFVRMAEEARAHLAGPEQRSWLARLDAERENILAAHEWAGRAADGAQAGLVLVNSTKLYWAHRGLLELGHRLVSEALQRPGAAEANLARCRALFNAGQFCYFMGRYAQARQSLEESLAIARALGDAGFIADILQPLGMAAIGQGELGTARPWLEEAVELTRASRDPRAMAGALNALAMLLRVQGDMPAARGLYDEMVQVAAEAGFRDFEAAGLLNVAMLAIDAGDAAGAQLLARAVRIAEELGSAPAMQSALEVCAGLAAAQGQWRRAASFYGAGESLAAKSGVRRDAADDRFLQPKMAQARNRLGEEAFAEACGEGMALPAEQAVREAGAWLAGAASLSTA